MSAVEFAFDWEDPGGARGAELRATWARLQITVGGEVVTRLIDRRSRSVRDAVYLPLYPLAEWLATHWWVLLYEPEVPGRTTATRYEDRHNLRSASKGFALPDLSIRPTGESAHLAWRRTALPAQRVEFAAENSAVVHTRDLRAQIGAFIEAVVRRLDESDVRGTLLQQEWAHLQGADPDEQDFCIAAASLGLDPYDVNAEQARVLVETAGALPYELRRAFYESADPGRLREQASIVADALQRAAAQRHDHRFLYDVRRALQDAPSASWSDGASTARVPWVDGHALARQLRELLGLGDRPLQTPAALAQAFRTSPAAPLGVDYRISRQARAPFDALLAPDADRGPTFVVSERGRQAEVFVICRALYEFLRGDDAPRLITRARTDAQQRNRAFAAEFLAPVAALRSRLNSDELPDEEAEDIAAEFGVSPLVVRYQLENHGVVRVRPPHRAAA